MHQLLQLLSDHQSFLLTGHENPDGDCLGAQVALHHMLLQMGKQVHIVNPDPISRMHDFLQRHTPFGHARGQEPLPPFQVVVLLDCAWLSRVGPLGERLRASGAKIAVIDHHVGSEDGDGDVHYVDAAAPATGALVRRLYRELGQPLDPAAAEGVFLSLVSDTGWYRYSNTTPEVMQVAAEMIEHGVAPDQVFDQLYRRQHVDSPQILAVALQGSRLLLDQRLAVASLDRALMERAARADFDTDAVLEPLRSLAGVEVVALFKERFDGRVKLSLRAVRDVDVQRIAAEFGGGGHKKAAGATLSIPLDAAMRRVEQLVAEALDAGRGGA